MIRKTYVKANQLVRDSFVLAAKVFDSGFRPDVLLVLWRGGTPVGVAVHEYLLFKGLRMFHSAIKAQSYTGIGRRGQPVIESLTAVLGAIRKNSRVLVVDDIFDTGCTMQRVRKLLERKTRHIRIATLYYKRHSNLTRLEPDYFVRETDEWIVFPHELIGLTMPEIRRKDAVVHRLLKRRTGSGGKGLVLKTAPHGAGGARTIRRTSPRPAHG